MSNHPDTRIISSGNWFNTNKYLENIPQPACVWVDITNQFSDVLPNIFIQVEPNIIINNEKYLIENHHKYHTIFTFNKQILEKCPNAKFYIYGTTWIPKSFYESIDISKKKFQISTLAGSKLMNNAPGHVFRQILHLRQKQFSKFPITFFRSFQQRPHLVDLGNNPFIPTDSKLALFETFQFAIVIENSQQENYFTEKIMDCLISKTIPIYFGCPNIDKFFNIEGWIILKTPSIQELAEKLEILNKKYYNKYTNVIEENFLKAIEYSDLYKNINNAG
jgi:hypothetical protein